jgi:hypothetical protein
VRRGKPLAGVQQKTSYVLEGPRQLSNYGIRRRRGKIRGDLLTTRKSAAQTFPSLYQRFTSICLLTSLANQSAPRNREGFLRNIALVSAVRQSSFAVCARDDLVLTADSAYILGDWPSSSYILRHRARTRPVSWHRVQGISGDLCEGSTELEGVVPITSKAMEPGHAIVHEERRAAKG